MKLDKDFNEFVELFISYNVHFMIAVIQCHILFRVGVYPISVGRGGH